MKCFVTVGTTRFDLLINSILADFNIKALQTIGITELVMQIGAGEFLPLLGEKAFDGTNTGEGTGEIDGLLVSFYRYKKSIIEDIKSADMVVGHAGAGTCIECLNAGKPLIVVVNDKLMDNHQLELADKLAELNHLVYCVPARLEEAIKDPRLFNLTPYQPPPFKLISQYLDRKLGLLS